MKDAYNLERLFIWPINDVVISHGPKKYILIGKVLSLMPLDRHFHKLSDSVKDVDSNAVGSLRIVLGDDVLNFSYI